MNLYKAFRNYAHDRKAQWMHDRDVRSAERTEAARVKLTGVWLDVGAHLAERTIEDAQKNPDLTIYAFEAGFATAVKLMQIAPPNVKVVPFAVSETDGPLTLNLNDNDNTHSLLPLSPDGWSEGQRLAPISQACVQSIRLDTFLAAAGIESIGFLKVDTQGTDLAVLRSAGRRLSDVRKVQVEVCVSSNPQYIGEGSKSEMMQFLTARGFTLTDTVVHAGGNLEDLTFERI